MLSRTLSLRQPTISQQPRWPHTCRGPRCLSQRGRPRFGSATSCEEGFEGVAFVPFPGNGMLNLWMGEVRLVGD